MLVRLISVLVALVVLVGLYFAAALKWSYSSGERAGWVQKLSKKGWVCKTWEGELAMVSMPGAAPEKFFFTVFDDEVAQNITKAMGKRVSLHYEEKVGLPTTCFGETRHYVKSLTVADEVSLMPGVAVPVPGATPGTTPAPNPAATPAPAAPTAAAPVAPPAAPGASRP